MESLFSLPVRYIQSLLMEEARKQRAQSKRLLTMALKQVDSALTNQLGVEVIHGRLEKAEKQMEVVTQKYEEYLALAYPNEEEVSNEDIIWYDTVTSDYDKVDSLVRSKVTSSIKEESTQIQVKVLSEEAILRKNLQRKCEYEKTLLLITFDTLEKCIEDPNSAIDTLKSAQNDAKDKLDKYRDLLRDYSISLPQEQMNECLNSVKECMSRFSSLNIAAGKAIEIRLTKGKENDTKDVNQSIFRLERMKLPSFDGNIREYPRFINDFKKYIIPKIRDNESASYVLRTCLSGKALDTIRNVDDNLDKMLERLNERFGQKSKLADVIMNEIKHLRQVHDNDEKGFVKLVNVIENSYNDLERIEMEQEISNSTIVSLIEEKLPKFIKSQWCLEIVKSKIDETDKFSAILKFLLMHKDAIEYGCSDFRSHTSQRSGLTNYGQGSSFQSSQRTQMNSATNSNKSTRETCWIHKVGSNDGHAIWHCKDFLAMAIPERLQLTTENKACKRCLLMKCPGSLSNENCWGNFKCRKNGCNKFHNTLLHQDAASNVVARGSTNHTNDSPVDINSNQNGAALLPLQDL